MTPAALAVLATRAAELTRPPCSLRPGQAAWSALCEMDETFARRIQATQSDPYHDDANLPWFWHAVTEAALDQDEPNDEEVA